MIPVAPLNTASVPIPSAGVAQAEPAKVETDPSAGDILRTLQPLLVVTYEYPLVSIATPQGLLKVAAALVPSTELAVPEPDLKMKHE